MYAFDIDSYVVHNFLFKIKNHIESLLKLRKHVAFFVAQTTGSTGQTPKSRVLCNVQTHTFTESPTEQ